MQLVHEARAYIHIPVYEPYGFGTDEKHLERLRSAAVRKFYRMPLGGLRAQE
jgi:hypothetical protein